MDRATSSSSSHIWLFTALRFSGRSNVTVTTPSARSTCSVSIAGTILTRMGLNPFRQQRRSPADYLMVAGAVLACLLLILWALFG